MLGLYTNFCFTRNMSLKSLYILSLKLFLDYIFMSFEFLGRIEEVRELMREQICIPTKV